MPYRFEKYFQERRQHLFDHLDDYESISDERSLHRLRVGMKQSKALFKFLRKQYKKHKLKEASNALKVIFRAAGEIREYQLILKWLRDNEYRFIEEAHFNEQELKKLKEYFHSCLPGYKKDIKDIFAKAEKYAEETNEKIAAKYVAGLYVKLEKMRMKDLPVKEWHELRKLIKQWIYSIDWIKKKQAGKYEKVLEYYENLQRVIGDWHDIEIVKETLTEKQVYLSRSEQVHKDFALAWEKLIRLSEEKQQQIEEMLQRTAE